MVPNVTRIRGFVILTAALGTWPAAGSVPAQQPAVSKDQQIKDFERQLDEMKKKLDELKGTATPAAPPPKPTDVKLAPEWLKSLAWRSIGPANMGGRIVAFSVFEPDPCNWWIATASGGLLKTMNNGITFEHQFDMEATVSIGDVCVAPSDKNVVWVGTGENNPRNSVSYGDGVYKSTNGGKTWKNMGLANTFQIGRIVIHPRDPNVVYVGALGRLYGPNPERGLFKTTDGGTTWNKILFVDDKTGAIDMRMHPTEPDTLVVATYERERDLYDVNDPSKKFGAGAGLYKTTNGGKNFKKLTKGLPAGPLGRIGLDWYRKDPKIVFAIIESEKIAMGPKGAKPVGNGYTGIAGRSEEDKTEILTVAADSPGAKAGLKVGDLLLAVDGTPVTTYADYVLRLADLGVGDKLKLKIGRGTERLDIEVPIGERPGSGRGPGGGRAGGESGPDTAHPFSSGLGGQRENIQDRQEPDGAQYGGVFKSTDSGESWTRINSLNPRPMYFSQIRVDPDDDKYLYVLGISLYRSTNGGKTFRGDGGRGVHSDHHVLWIDPRDGRHMVLGGDGGLYVTCDRMDHWDHLNHAAIGQFYHVAIDTRRDYRVYGGLQDNGSWGGPSRTHNGIGPVNEDWVSVGGGDGFKCQVDPNDPDQIYYTSQGGAMGRRNFRTGETAPIRPRNQALGRGPVVVPTPAPAPTPRPAATQTPAAARQPAGQERHRFNWNTPFMLSHHNSKIFYAAGDVVFRSLDRGNDLRVISPVITRTDKGSATALGESPRNPSVLYVGTDDGALWVTKDGGTTWTDVVKNVGLVKPAYVATIEPSRYEEGRAYVAFDGHRSDIDDPLIFVTEDFGATWKPLRGTLPRGSSHCLREDIKNPDLLYLGTEFKFWVSLDRGQSWMSLNTNLPTVAIHDIALHPTAGELVAATHGRSLWTLDLTPLRQTTRAVAQEKVHLYKPVSAISWRPGPSHGGTIRRFEGQNPPAGVMIDYALAQKAGKLSLKILDVSGAVVSELRGTTEPGLHRVPWNLSRGSGQRGGFGGGGSGGGAGGGPARAAVGAPSAAAQPPPAAESPRGSESESAAPVIPAGRAGGFGRALNVAPGLYRVVLAVDGTELSQTIRVEPDPNAPIVELAADEEEEMQNDYESDEMSEEGEEGEEGEGPDKPIIRG